MTKNAINLKNVNLTKIKDLLIEMLWEKIKSYF